MAEDRTVNINLAPELERIIETKMGSGHYHSADEVIGEALRLMSERDHLISHHNMVIRQRIDEGMASLRNGEAIDGEAFMAALDAELEQLNH